VVLHALRELPGYDFVVLLQPTSPLRTADDVDAALVHCVDSGAPSCVSISPAPHSPYWMYFMNQDTTLRSVLEAPPGATRRQDLPPAYALNGAIYVASVPWFQAGRSFVTAETVAYVMPEERSIDIDTAADLESFRRIVEGNPSGQVPAAP
jgi:N-acylneuraminate cytidylyltransferase